MIRLQVRLILIIAILWIGGGVSAFAKLSKVLFIDSYSRDYEKTNVEADVIINQLLNDRVPIDFSVQYLSSEIFPDTTVWIERMNLFMDQCRRDKPDAIVLISDEAWTTFRSCNRTGLDNIPIILSSCRSQSLPLGKLQNRGTTLSDYIPTQSLMRAYNAIGELRELNPTLLFNLMDTLLPKRNSYLIITDDQYLGRLNQLIVQKFLKEHRAGVPAKFLNPSILSTDSLCRYLSQTGPNTATYLFEWNDPQSQVSSRFTRSRLEGSTQTPFFINSSEMLNSDAQLAGNYISLESWGNRTCDIIEQVLFGISPKDLPSEVVEPQQLFVNCDALSRFNIAMCNLPDGIVLINKPPRFFTQYKNTTIVIAVLGTLLLIIIMTLVAWNRKMHILMVREKETLLKIEQKNEDLHQAQQQLVQALDSTKEIDKIKSSFLSNMSHEIRTPLNAIIGFSELLIDTDDPDERKIYMDTILKNNALLLKLVNDVLDISRLDSGRVNFSESECSVYELFCELHTNNEALVAPEIEFIVAEPKEDYVIEIDRSRLYQILSNFISNASKFTLRGHIKLLFKKDSQHLYLSVEDTGIGIAEDKLKTIFTRFEKVNGYDQGVGLGLSLASSVAEHMGGKILVTSKVLSGSTFTLQLPIERIVSTCEPQKSSLISINNRRNDKESEQTSRSEIHVAEKPQNEIARCEETVTATATPTSAQTQEIRPDIKSKIRILYAEDNDSNFLLVERLFAGRFNLIRARNGQEAVDRFTGGNFNVVLMDLLMPVMGGIEAIKQIRSINQQIPIIAVSASVFETDVHEAHNAGCNAFLPKPVNIQILMDTLKKIEEEQTKSGL